MAFCSVQKELRGMHRLTQSCTGNLRWGPVALREGRDGGA